MPTSNPDDVATECARVLVIDDDPLFRSLITTLLKKEYSVVVASDGAEGYFKALEQRPDVVVVDVQMPEWDGLQTLKAFRAHPALARIPLVMLTADTSRETILAAIQAGASDYIIKSSFSKEELFQKLRRLIPACAPPTEASLAGEVPLSVEKSVPHGHAPALVDYSTGETATMRELNGIRQDSTTLSDYEIRLQDLIENW